MWITKPSKSLSLSTSKLVHLPLQWGAVCLMRVVVWVVSLRVCKKDHCGAHIPLLQAVSCELSDQGRQDLRASSRAACN